jgi:phage shock protein E
MNFITKFFKKYSNDDEILAWIKNGAILIDVRTAGEFKANFVLNSINLPLDNLYSQINKLDKNLNYIVFCRSGNRSGHAKDILLKNGFKKVFDAKTWEKVSSLQKSLQND